jgi:ubiquinone/menaquinone biosynthesis C-methylase UbiE
MPDKPHTSDDKLQQEFNRWATAGEGLKMEQHHLDITEKTIRLMNLRPGERVLDLGCGSGWATRLLARLVGDGPEGFGQVVGLDVSDEMVRQARESSKDFDNILYVWVVLLLSRPRPGADGIVSRDGAARQAVHSDQPL